MRVLVVQTTPGSAADTVDALTAAGHSVATCHDEGASFPCHGLGSGPGCPLEQTGGVDVALLVRDPAEAGATASEDGVRCALRHHVPLAVVGAASSPYDAVAAASSHSTDEVLGVVDRARTAPMAAHTGVARTALATVLTASGIDPAAAEVTVSRHGSALTVALDPGCPVDPQIMETASVRVLAAVRGLDRTATVIDVTAVRHETDLRA